ncbi:hypothetical protein BAE44_0018597, partial [Dichanthelium oligosanthes]
LRTTTTKTLFIRKGFYTLTRSSSTVDPVMLKSNHTLVSRAHILLIL